MAWVRMDETESVEEGLSIFHCRCGEEIVLDPREVLSEGPLQEDCDACGIRYIFIDA